MLFWKKKGQYEKRYMVLWNALLEVRFPDFQDQLSVTVDHFSGVDAVVNADRVFLNGRYLIAENGQPELNVKIFSPEGVFESGIEIRWYRWSVKKSIYEIGIKFINTLKDKQTIIDRIIKKLRHQQMTCGCSP